MNTVELSLGSCKPFEFMAPWRSIKAVCANDFALDLGTANTLIYTGEQGIVVNQPSVIAVEEISDKVLAVGHAAKEMLGKTSRAIRCIRPMKDGVVADSQMTALMMRQFLRTARRRRCLFKPQVVIGVPGGTTQVEKRAVIEALHVAGARAVKLVEEPMAAAIGAGLPVDKSIGSMIVDIGGGTTEVAVLTRNETLYSHSIRVAGDEMDEAIQRHLQKNHHLQIGILEAERIKLVIGSALPSGKRRFATVCGRDLSTFRPHRIEICDEEIRLTLQEPISAIISSVSTALEQVNAGISRDVVARGVCLSGGGALLKGMAERLTRETGTPFHVAADPLTCVARGIGKIVENLREFSVFCIA